MCFFLNRIFFFLNHRFQRIPLLNIMSYFLSHRMRLCIELYFYYLNLLKFVFHLMNFLFLLVLIDLNGLFLKHIFHCRFFFLLYKLIQNFLYLIHLVFQNRLLMNNCFLYFGYNFEKKEVYFDNNMDFEIIDSFI